MSFPRKRESILFPSPPSCHCEDRSKPALAKAGAAIPYPQGTFFFWKMGTGYFFDLKRCLLFSNTPALMLGEKQSVSPPSSNNQKNMIFFLSFSVSIIEI